MPWPVQSKVPSPLPELILVTWDCFLAPQNESRCLGKGTLPLRQIIENRLESDFYRKHPRVRDSASRCPRNNQRHPASSPVVTAQREREFSNDPLHCVCVASQRSVRGVTLTLQKKKITLSLMPSRCQTAGMTTDKFMSQVAVPVLS